MTRAMMDARSADRFSTVTRPRSAGRRRGGSPVAHPRASGGRPGRPIQPPAPDLATAPSAPVRILTGVQPAPALGLRPTERALCWMIALIAVVVVTSVLAIAVSFFSVSNAPLGGSRPAVAVASSTSHR